MVDIFGGKFFGKGTVSRVPRGNPHEVAPQKTEGPKEPHDSALTPPSLPDAQARRVVGGDNGSPALSQGVTQGVGNAFSTRLDVMTGGVNVPSWQAELDALKAALESGQVPTSLPLSALDIMPIPKSGLALQLDGAKVAGQRVVVRKIHDPEHGPGLEFVFKLRHSADIREVKEKILAAGGSVGTMTAERKELDESGRYIIDRDREGYTFPEGGPATSGSSSPSPPAECTELVSYRKYRIGILSDRAPQAVRGLVRLRVFEGSSPRWLLNWNLTEALEKTGLSSALAPSTEETRSRLSQMRVLWQRDPKRAQELAEQDLDDPAAHREIEKALKAVGVDPAEAGSLKVKEVFPGHFTVVDPAQAERYKELGVKYLYRGVPDIWDVIRILTSDGLMSATERYARGRIIDDASTEAELHTGGADYVQVRMVTKDAKNIGFDEVYDAGHCQLVYGPEVLGRTDWFAYDLDDDGTTTGEKFTSRKYGKELVESLKIGQSGFAIANEVRFQTGLSNRDLVAIFTDTQERKQTLIQALEEAGITEIGGKPLSEAIQVRTKMVE